MSASRIPGRWIDLGQREYGEVWELQKRLVSRRQLDEIPDLLLLVEHPPVLTVGRRISAQSNIHDESLPVFEIERGGDVTYHGPGQLVGYPILKLRDGERDLHAYLRNLEEALIDVCRELELEGGRRAGWTGVWIGERKVASIGIAVRRWVTLHGFALNVTTNLAHFKTINPCGLDATVMTSLREAAGRWINLETLKPVVAARLGDRLGRDFSPAETAVD